MLGCLVLLANSFLKELFYSIVSSEKFLGKINVFLSIFININWKYVLLIKLMLYFKTVIYQHLMCL